VYIRKKLLQQILRLFLFNFAPTGTCTYCQAHVPFLTKRVLTRLQLLPPSSTFVTSIQRYCAVLLIFLIRRCWKPINRV